MTSRGPVAIGCTPQTETGKLRSRFRCASKNATMPPRASRADGSWYRDTDLGPYDELVISFLVRRRGAVAAAARRKPFRQVAATLALSLPAGDDAGAGH